MADTVTTQSSVLSTVPTGTIIATDDAGAGGQVQIVKLAVSTDGSATAIPASSAGLRVQTSPLTTSTLPAATNVSIAASSTQVLASNTSRLGVVIYNDHDTSLVYINLGGTASTTAFAFRLEPRDTLILPQPIYTGAINHIGSAAAGTLRVTEYI